MGPASGGVEAQAQRVARRRAREVEPRRGRAALDLVGLAAVDEGARRDVHVDPAPVAGRGDEA